MIPHVEIVSKEVIYKSRIYITPLKNPDEIDKEAVGKLIKQEYRRAGVEPKDVDTGAVIITGESLRKNNARELTCAMAEYAGDFVVAAAGPDLESLLAGRGAGCDKLSIKTGRIAANLDIGGGTTNISVFRDGKLFDTACYDIGGRLIKLNQGKIIYIAEKMKPILKKLDIHVKEGEVLECCQAERICICMTDILAEALGYGKRTELGQYMITNHGLKAGLKPEIITFSGGVADCFNSRSWFAFGDLGDVLGRTIKNSPLLSAHCVERAAETMRATVIGAGNFSLEVSGSTIEYSGCSLPLKNIPVIGISCETPEDISWIEKRIREEKIWMEAEEDLWAVSMAGPPCPSFGEIEAMAEELVRSAGQLLVVITRNDIAKALGQAIKRKSAGGKSFICIDGINCRSGDFIDIGSPVAHKCALPVVIKTLLFED